MNTASYLIPRTVTPEYVLDVLKYINRQQWEWACEPPPSLTFETTVEQWFDFWDIDDWRSLVRDTNSVWRLDYTDNEWRAVLKPVRSRALREVCEFIAAKAIAPDFRPANILGKQCRAAGAFMAIKSLLEADGADVSQLAPSTPLAEFTRRHLQLFLGPIARLAPSALPVAKVVNPAQDVCLKIFGVSLAVTFFCSLLARWIGGFAFAMALSGFAAMLGSCIAASITVRYPKGAEFSGLETFRDLATRIASDGEPASS